MTERWVRPVLSRFEPGATMRLHCDANPHWSLVVQGSLLECSGSGSVRVGPGALVGKPTTAQHETKIGPAGAVILQLIADRELSHYGWSLDVAGASLMTVATQPLKEPIRLRLPDRPTTPRSQVIKAAISHLKASPSCRLTDLAQQLQVHPNYLSGQFRSETNQTFGMWRRLFRLAQAANLIAGGHGIGSAAHEAGFADHAHLSRAFQATYGLTPRTYQNFLCESV